MLNLTRRSFLQVAAAASALAAVAPQATVALAEQDVPAHAAEVKRIRSCCRACGKMECGVWVTVENGKAVKIEGDESAWHSRGNC